MLSFANGCTRCGADMTRGHGAGGWICSRGHTGEPSIFGNRPAFQVRDPRVMPECRDAMLLEDGDRVTVAGMQWVPTTPLLSRVLVVREKPGATQFRRYDFSLAEYRQRMEKARVIFVAGYTPA